MGEHDAERRPRRQRVERRINAREAATVRRIFELCANGTGYTRIAKLLNSEHAPCPRPQQARPAGWSPSTINAILHRPLYHGVLVWNQTKKRDQWGRRTFTPRPQTEWLTIPAPALRIVSDELWRAAHQRLDDIPFSLADSRKSATRARSRDVDSNYLLPGFARCAVCGGGLCVTSSSSAGRCAFFYTCLANHKRGAAVCSNGKRVGMARVDSAVLGALAGDVLRPDVVTAVVRGVLASLQSATGVSEGERARLTRELQAATREAQRLTEAIAAGGQLAPLLVALQARQGRADEDTRAARRSPRCETRRRPQGH